MNPTREQLEAANALLRTSDNDAAVALRALKQALSTASAKPAAVRSAYVPKHAETIITVSHLVKSYKVGHTTVQALRDVNLQIHKGEFVAITGTSGSGKSTLLQLMGGLDKPESGTIEVAGQTLGQLRDSKLSAFRNRTIGFIFQFFYLQPFLNLQTNIEVPGMFARTPARERAAASAELAGQVGLAERTKHLPRELSGGQMQRAAIARALFNRPPLLLADEPTGNLDSANAKAIFTLFRDICEKQGTTIVVVTHDRELAALADRCITVSDGAVV